MFSADNEIVFNYIQKMGGRKKYKEFISKTGKTELLSDENFVIFKNARDRLFKKHENLVYLAVHRLKKPEISDELFQYARINLLRAIESFNPNKGFAFTTFALYILSFSYGDYIHEKRKVKINSRQRKLLRILLHNSCSLSECRNLGYTQTEIDQAQTFLGETNVRHF
jgi:DNA-directed RNA polymerase specialized sigma subunit